MDEQKRKNVSKVETPGGTWKETTVEKVDPEDREREVKRKVSGPGGSYKEKVEEDLDTGATDVERS